MFTIKRVMNGDTFLEEAEKPVLSEKRTNGEAFREAKALFNELPPVEGATEAEMAKLTTQEDTLGETREIINISEAGGLAYLEASEAAQQPSTVTLTVWSDGKESIAKACKPGNLRLDDAIAVLVSTAIGEDEGSFNTHYDFIYPGDEVYIVNRYGNTVSAVR